MIDTVYIIFLIIFNFYKILTGYSYLTSKYLKNKEKLVIMILIIEILSFIYIFYSRLIPLTAPSFILIGAAGETYFHVKNFFVIFSGCYLIFDLSFLAYLSGINIKILFKKYRIVSMATGLLFLFNGIFSIFIFI